MRATLTALCSVFLVAVCLAGPVRAGDADAVLDKLFAQLQKTQNPREAHAIEAAIWNVWLTADQEYLNTLMRQGTKAMNARDFDLAQESFDAYIELAPDRAEGFNKRATMYFMMGDYKASIEDVERTLALEPRHFGAWAGLGLIYDALGEKEAALKAMNEALKINPHLNGVAERAKQIKREIEARKI